MNPTLVSLTLSAALAMAVLPAAPALAAPTCFGEEATIVAGDGSEKVIGTERDDVIYGDDGPYHVESKGGNDRICVSGYYPDGVDTVYGGEGADRIRVGAGQSAIYGEGGRDLIYGRDGQDHIEGGPMGDRIFGGEGEDYLYGDGGHDEIRGGTHRDTVHGYDGDDTLAGGPGIDEVMFTELCCDYSYDAGGVRIDLRQGTASAADGDDTLGGFELVYGTNGDDEILGSGSRETIQGLDGNDTIDGRGGDDMLIPDYMFDNTNGADDAVAGGAGVDTIHYGGSQPMTVNLSRGTAGGPDKGSDTVKGVEDILGSWGKDRLIGNAADNHILADQVGQGANDYLDGRGGTDVLDGAFGKYDKCVNGEEVLRCER